MKRRRTFTARLTSSLSDLEAEISLLETRSRGHAIELAEKASPSDVVVAVGGDGTFNEVVNGVMQYGRKHPDEPQPLVGLIPAGSANDFAGTNGFDRDFLRLKELIGKRVHRNVDVGEVLDGSTGRVLRYFINVADVGLGADVVNRLENNRSWTRNLPPDFKFLLMVTKSFFSYRRKKTLLRFDDQEWAGEVLAVIIANNSTFGSGLVIAPEARIDDGLFNLVILGKVSITDYVRNVFRVKAGKRIDHEDVHYHQVRSVEITSSIPQEVEVDGEWIGTTPVSIRFHENQIKLLGGTAR